VVGKSAGSGRKSANITKRFPSQNWITISAVGFTHVLCKLLSCAFDRLRIDPKLHKKSLATIHLSIKGHSAHDSTSLRSRGLCLPRGVIFDLNELSLAAIAYKPESLHGDVQSLSISVSTGPYN